MKTKAILDAETVSGAWLRDVLDMSAELKDAAIACQHNGVRIEDLACEHYNCAEAEIVGGNLQIGNGGEWDGMKAQSGESVQAFLFWMEVQNG